MTKTFIVDSVGGISGSLTQLVDGSSYLIAGSGVSITSQSNGSVIITSDGTSSASGFYGDGSDGTVVLNGTNTVSWASLSSNVYTLGYDVYLDNLSVDSAVTLKTNGYRIFVNNNCDVTGTIDNSGGRPFGAPEGSLPAGGNGSLGSPGNLRGLGGSGGAGSNGAGSTILRPTTTGNVRSLPDVVSSRFCGFDTSSQVVIPIYPAGGGGGDGANFGGGGGGYVVLVTSKLNLTSGSVISANGGNGAGSGGGGGGGVVVIVTNSGQFNNAGTIQTIGGSGHVTGSSGIVMTFAHP